MSVWIQTDHRLFDPSSAQGSQLFWVAEQGPHCHLRGHVLSTNSQARAALLHLVLTQILAG